jgi:predicted nuclease with TOPRIM domain
METPFAVYDALSAINIPPDKIRVVVQSMERDMALFATQSQFGALDQQSAGRFDLLRAEVDSFRERFEQVDRRFEQIDRRFEQVDKRFEQMDKRFEQVDKCFEQVDKRFEQVDKRFEQIDRRFDLADKRLTEAMHHIEQRLTVRLGSFLAVSTAVTATLVVLLRGGAAG